MLRDKIITILQEHREELRERFKVKSLALFGSVARGEETPDSDVDILFDFDRPFTLLTWANAERAIAELIGRKVDLVSREDLIPQLKDRILAEAINA